MRWCRFVLLGCFQDADVDERVTEDAVDDILNNDEHEGKITNHIDDNIKNEDWNDEHLDANLAVNFLDLNGVVVNVEVEIYVVDVGSENVE